MNHKTKIVLSKEHLLELFKLPISQRTNAINQYLSTGKAITVQPIKSNV